MNEDLVMESTTDTAEQMAEGLGSVLRETDPQSGLEVPAEEHAVSTEQAAAADAGEAVQAETADDAVEEVVEVAPRQAREKSPNGKAAAARITASKKLRAVEEENQRLREQLRQQVTGAQPAPTRSVAKRVELPPVEPVKADDVPDTHPEVAKALQAIDAIGPRPKSEDFDDYNKFEEARDEWIERRATARARINFVREDVARRETAALDDANREFHKLVEDYTQTVDRARERHEDYDDAMAAAEEQGLSVSQDMKDALMRSPEGGEVIYHLVTHPEEVARLNALPTSRALAELGKIESRIEASLKRQPASRQQPTTGRPAARITRAPEPTGTTLGDLPSANNTGLDDPNLSLAEYNRLRDQMDVQSGRRRPVGAF